MVPFITITLLLHLDACSKHKKYFRCFEYKLQKLFHTFFRCFRQYVFAVIDSKWKASIFNTYSDIWPSVHRYTYIIAIAREVWLNMLTRYVCETLVLCEIFLSILALETTSAVKTFLYICSIIGCKAYVCFCRRMIDCRLSLFGFNFISYSMINLVVC